MLTSESSAAVRCDFDRGRGLGLSWSGCAGCSAHNLEITGTNPHITISLSGGKPPPAANTCIQALNHTAQQEHDRSRNGRETLWKLPDAQLRSLAEHAELWLSLKTASPSHFLLIGRFCQIRSQSK